MDFGAILVVGLNSTMVRLQQWKNKYGERIVYCLNSTMVRLQLQKIENMILEEGLSQFHYGSITTFVLSYATVVAYESLNSTMVRLQHKFRRLMGQAKPVSIPLWFDYNTNIAKYQL